MFPRNPENKAWCLPQPAKGAAPPRGPTDAELPGVCVRVCMYIHVCSVCTGACRHCVRACACTRTVCDQVHRFAMAPVFLIEKAQRHCIRRPASVPRGSQPLRCKRPLADAGNSFTVLASPSTPHPVSG